MGRKMGKEEWVAEAMKDEFMVVEVLLLLRQPAEQASQRLVKVFPEWGLRQRRTRQIQGKKVGESRRASPTTPLSWSGATSFSGSGAGAGAGSIDCHEESSHTVKHSTGDRSKVLCTNATAGKRSRKKKTYGELKEEESLLLKESIRLRKELEALRINFEEQRTRNESFKRMKLQFEAQSDSHRREEKNALMVNNVCVLPDLNLPFQEDS